MNKCKHRTINVNMGAEFICEDCGKALYFTTIKNAEDKIAELENVLQEKVALGVNGDEIYDNYRRDD